MGIEERMNVVYDMNKYGKFQYCDSSNRPLVDEWDPGEDSNQLIVTCRKGFFIVPLDILLRLDISDEESKKLNYFTISIKKCYNSPDMRLHLFRYVNYYCNFYDPSAEYLSVLLRLKIKMDRYPTEYYPSEVFFNDMDTYILKSNIVSNVQRMVEDNYHHELQYSNMRNQQLQYTNEHAKKLHIISILMNLCIPLLTHYAYMHKVSDLNEYLLSFYDRILHLSITEGIYQKLYDTAFTNTNINQKNNPGIWDKQDIRSIDTTTHSVDIIENIVLNIMPKYTFEKNIISFNYASIRTSTDYKITDIAFEFSYIAISSSKRDNDSISDFDKFESNLIRMNEGLYLQNKINGQVCMETIRNVFGPFDPKEIEHYDNRILKDSNGNYTVNSFQKQLIFDLFYRWFKDTQSINSINRIEYVQLILAAKKLLLSKNMKILPYIIAGKIDKFVQRKTVNKKEKMIVEASKSFPLILEKYRNADIINNILSIVATIISSDFSIVDLDPEVDGKLLKLTVGASINMVIEEIEMFILMC